MTDWKGVINHTVVKTTEEAKVPVLVGNVTDALRGNTYGTIFTSMVWSMAEFIHECSETREIETATLEQFTVAVKEMLQVIAMKQDGNRRRAAG